MMEISLGQNQDLNTGKIHDEIQGFDCLAGRVHRLVKLLDNNTDN